MRVSQRNLSMIVAELRDFTRLIIVMVKIPIKSNEMI